MKTPKLPLDTMLGFKISLQCDNACVTDKTGKVRYASPSVLGDKVGKVGFSITDKKVG